MKKRKPISPRAKRRKAHKPAKPPTNQIVYGDDGCEMLAKKPKR